MAVLVCSIAIAGALAAAEDGPLARVVVTGESPTTHSAFQVAYDAFVSVAKGWAEVRDLRRTSAGSPNGAAVHVEPTIVLALGPGGLDQARREFPEVPRVFALAAGEDCDLAPRRSETGVVLRLAPDDLVRVLTELWPTVHRVGYLASATTNPCGPHELERALTQHGLEFSPGTVTSVREGLQALRTMRGSVDAVILLPNPDVISDETVEYAIAAGLERRIPVVGFSPRIAASGALFSVSLDPRAIAEQAADLAKQVIAGGVPAPRLPRKQRLTINFRTARLLNIDVPEELRKRAAEGAVEP